MSLTAPNLAAAWTTLKPSLSKQILDNLHNKLEYFKMTPVQASTIPLFMGNKDVVVEAVTGSGKTLAYLIPMLEKITPLIEGLENEKQDEENEKEEEKEDSIQNNKNQHLNKSNLKPELLGLILAPTRELATQIFKVLEQIGTGLNVRSQLLIGGKIKVETDIQILKKEKPHIIIGTPGRVEELIAKRKELFSFKNFEMLVLDEADRLLELGFTSAINNLLTVLPKQRRTGLFSATMTDGLNELLRVGLRNPVKVVVKVSVSSQKDCNAIQQRIPDSLKVGYMIIDDQNKLQQLLKILETSQEVQRTIIYFATCACVDFFYQLFQHIPQFSDYKLVSLHGKMDVKRRTVVFKNYLELPNYVKSILLTTDVAGRGLDLPQVDLVLHYDVPTDPTNFSHRCGRAARAGNSGKAIYFLREGTNEVVYPDFLKVRKVPSSPIEPFEIIDPMILLKILRDKVAKDRAFVDKGIKAFVSFIRAYSKHQTSYIFNLKEIDYAKLAWAYALLKLPKMPELKGKKVEFEEHSTEVSTIAFLHEAKEAKRQRLLELKANDIPQLNKKVKKSTSEAWSENNQRKLRKKKRAEKARNKLKEVKGV